MVWRWLAKLKPDPEAQRGMIWWLGGLALLAAAFGGFSLQSGLGMGVDILAGLLLGVAGLVVSWTAAWLMVKIIPHLPWKLVGVLVAAAVALAQALHINLAQVYPIWLAGLGAVLLTGWAWGQIIWRRRRWLWPVLLLGLGLNAALVYAFTDSGSDAHLIDLGLPEPVGFILNAPDPGQPGPYDVTTFTYGSGDDRHRPEFAEEADLFTESISVAQFMGWREGIKRESRELFWGFDPTRFPRNGRVWLPVGEGPFPLVLMMHGNHNMTNFSDVGYAYLGEHLASHGYIFVSIDANFFNGYFTGAVNGENDARAWMILQHLQLWQEWHYTPSNPLTGKVNLEQIALIGHSRGGEAVAIAAAFNRLDHYPDNANILLRFNFNIRALIAIAPTDQQYQPASQPLPLGDTHYLVLHGSHDSDVSGYNGLRQYQRVNFSGDGDWFKAGLYIYRANHGQFNTAWGEYDLDWPRRLYLNTQALLPAEEQQQIARVMLTGFLHTTLRGETVYRPMFQDWRYAAAWLPDTYYINQYEDSHFRLLADFEEDVDVTSLSVAGGISRGWGLRVWREQGLIFRSGSSQENQVVHLGWSGGQGQYELFLPDGLADDLTIQDMLMFAAADSTNREQPLDFSITLIDAQGISVSLPLSQFATLLPQLPVENSRWPLYEEARYVRESETVLQTFRLPLSAFAAANPAFDPSTLQIIRFQFNQSQAGEIYLDRIGFQLSFSSWP